MCGIFGAIGKNWNLETVKLLAVLNDERGGDATGFFDGNIIYKSCELARDFLVTHNKHLSESQANKFILGHTRFGTTGSSKNPENAHPFNFGNVTGIHNGVIHNTWELEKQISKHLVVDSEYIFYLLNRKQNPNNAFKLLHGYFGLAWYDLRKPNKVYLCNHDCVLSYIIKNQVLYFSSDKEHLLIATGQKPVIVENNIMLEIDIDTLEITETKLKGIKTYKQKYSSYIFDDIYDDKFTMRCDFCRSTKDVKYSHDAGYHLCVECRNEYDTHENTAYTDRYLPPASGSEYAQCPYCSNWVRKDSIVRNNAYNIGVCKACDNEIKKDIKEMRIK